MTAAIKAISKPVRPAIGTKVRVERPPVTGMPTIAAVRTARATLPTVLIFFPLLTFSAKSPSITISADRDFTADSSVASEK